MGAVVTGMGVVSSIGADVAEFRRALLDGTCGCMPRAFTRMDGSVVTAPAYTARPAEAHGLIEPRKLRRMFRVVRMAAVAARQALADAQVDVAGLDPSRIGVVFGTSLGAIEITQKFVDSWLDQGEQHASPLNFMNSVHGILASQVALDIGATGVNLTTAQRDVCFEVALDTARAMLEQDRADLVLVGGADELTDLLHEIASGLHLVTLDLARRGLDPGARETTTIPGDGAAVFVLEREDTPRKPLAKLLDTRVGRHDAGCRQDLPAVELVTTCANGTSRGALGYGGRKGLSHRGNFGDFPAAGALQFAANVLMLQHREGYAPLTNGGQQSAPPPPASILHDARSISGNHAGYVLAK
ncbi:MAG: hypothetical protein KF696_04670 [Planctomycetes bacterium]|nr:hypothetical protein [Planctomycetota bacterium]MCW8134266.1 hypothetical protein [Planctomycetota bacterium]